MRPDVSQEFWEDWEYMVFGLRYGPKAVPRTPDEEGVEPRKPPSETWLEFEKMEQKFFCHGEIERRSPTELMMFSMQGVALAIERRDWARGRHYSDLLLRDPRFDELGPSDQPWALQSRAYLEQVSGHPQSATPFIVQLEAMDTELSRTMVEGLRFTEPDQK